MKSFIAKAIAHKQELEQKITEAANATCSAKLRFALQGIRPARGYYPPAINPRTYVDAILPFIKGVGYDYKTMKRAEVDPHLVIGGHFQNHAQGTGQEEDNKIEWLNSLTDAYADHGDINGNLARYAQVANLPLYVAVEGKNRVDLYRRRGKAIKAMITKWDYPKAEHLTLHCSLPFRAYYLRCHDERFLANAIFSEYEVLAYPEISLPILRQYGVKHGRGICVKPQALKATFDVKGHTCGDLMAP